MARTGRWGLLRAVAVFCAAAGLVTAGGQTASADTVTSIRATEWWLSAMHAPDLMWKTSTGKGITVAVIDSGVKANHPDLVGKVLPGKNFSALSGGATSDVDGHGTGMASFIAGTGKGWDGKGMYGLAPDVKILPLRVVGKGSNEAVFSVSFAGQLSAAIRYAADSDAKILNISMGQVENEPNVRSAVNYAIAKGKLVVAAVGNDGKSGDPVEYPAAFPGVVGVASDDKNAKIGTESEYGPQVAFAAPGEGMHRACTDPSGYCSSSGTSDATAIFSASAALVWAVHPDWTANQLVRVLIDTASTAGAVGVRDPHYGYGIVRPRDALAKPGDPGPGDVNPLLPVAASATPAPTTAAATPGAGAPSTAPTTAAKQSGGSGLWIGVGAAVVVVLGAVLAFVLVRRRRRQGPPPPPPQAPYTPYGHIPDPYRQQ